VRGKGREKTGDGFSAARGGKRIGGTLLEERLTDKKGGDWPEGGCSFFPVPGFFGLRAVGPHSTPIQSGGVVYFLG